MMDLSILERVLALRDEVQGEQLGEDSSEFAKISREAEGGGGRTSAAPEDKIASDLMARAMSLHALAEKSAAKEDRSSRTSVIELLKAASAPIEPFRESDPGADSPAPVTSDQPVDLAEEFVTAGPAAPEAPRKRSPQRKNTAPKKKAARGTKKKKK